MALASSFPCAVLLLTFLCESGLVRASGIPERILCVDINCQEKLGEGITLQDYSPVEKNYVRFKRNDRVTIYGMAGNDVLHVEVGKERGYVTGSFVKIEKQFKNKIDLVEVQVHPGLSSEAASTDATEAVKATVEPTLAEAAPSAPVTKSCNIHGTVMYGDLCDDEEATEAVADASDDAMRLQTSIDSPDALPYSALPLFRSTNGAKPGLPVDEEAKLPLDDLSVASTTEPLDTNTTTASEDPGMKADEERGESLSSDAADPASETSTDEGALAEDEESEESEDKPKPIPGEVDDDDDDGQVEEVTPDQSDQVEDVSVATKEVHTSLPLETGLDASAVDKTVASTVATPPLEQAVDPTEGASPTFSFKESSTSTSEASLPEETSYGYSHTDESKAAFSMSVDLPEQQHLNVSAPMEGSSSPLPSEQLSSVAASVSVPLDASPVDESTVASSTATPSLETQQSIPAASTEDSSSALLSDQPAAAATEGLAASVETGLGESSADEPPSSILTTPLVEPQLPEQTSSTQDVLSPALSSTATQESVPTSLAASLQAEPGDSFASQPAVSSSNVPQAEPQLPDQTFSMQDLSSPALSSTADQESKSSSLAASKPLQAEPGESSASQSTTQHAESQQQPDQAWLGSASDLSAAMSHSVPQDSYGELLNTEQTRVDEPLASATTVPLVEQPVATSTVEDSLSTASSVPPNQESTVSISASVGAGDGYLSGSASSSPATQSLDTQQVHSAFTEEVLSSALPTSQSDAVASLAPSTTTPSESIAGGMEATSTLQAHTTPEVPVGESLEPPPSLLPADDGLARPPGVPLPEKQTQPTEDEPSGFVLDWKVLEEYLWQVLSVVPEPLRAALEWPLVPSLPLLMACCALLVFSLGASLHAAWLQRRKVSSLTGILSEREQELFTLKTERQVLSEQLAQAKKDSVGNDRTLSEHKRELETLREATEERTKQMDKLSGQLSEKGQQLESAQAALQQAQKLLKERSAEAKERGDAAASLEDQLRETCVERDRWREQAQESQAEEEMLRKSLTDATETSDRLWAELEALKRRQEELCEEVSASNRQADSVAEKLRQKEDRIQVLESSLEQLELLQKRWRSRKSENESENGAENEVEGEEEGEEKANEEEGRRHSELRELLDATQARRERDQAEEQCRQLQSQLDELRGKLQAQEAQVESLRKDLESSVAIKVESERKCAEAQTKLEVLTEYFKDRELQLQREVGLQEFQRRQREADVSTTAQQVAVLEQQCQSYQSQLDSLRKEMQLTERNYKNQVTDQEKRAHDNWLAARAAERKLEDANRELSSLRQRLTLAERELQQRPPLLPPPDMFPPPPLPPRPRSKDGEGSSSLDGTVPPPPPPDMLVPPPPPLFGPFGMFGPFPPPPPPELRKMMRDSPGYFEDDDEMGSPMPPPPPHHHHHHHYMTPPPREGGGRSNRTSRSSSASESRGRPLKSSPQSPLSDDRRNGTSGRSTPL